ncbi:hypothetical protein RJ639_024183 [Escallonia herrerae]|uniref:F-box protein n=1 Tax=Escallonia herrerae TaxID=1293975 RepID=A0AA89ADK2_9ASTE|nr:hypothetical protein RJ639_024183 [Escallonia herrerae]
MMDILSTLPVKYLVQYRCISKGWHALVKNPLFISMHSRKSNDECYLILRRHNDCKADAFGDAYMLLNPATREFKPAFKYGTPEEATSKPPRLLTLGFGFDSMTNDYKIGRIERSEATNQMRSFCELYSERTNSWRRMDSAVDGLMIDRLCNADVNGFLHWLAIKQNGRLIISFDLRREVFGEITLPPVAHEPFHSRLGVWKGGLAVMFLFDDPLIDWGSQIWSLGDGTWRKDLIIYPSHREFVLLGSRAKKILFARWHSKTLNLYNRSDKTTTSVGLPGPVSIDVDVVDYRESLAKLNGAKILSETMEISARAKGQGRRTRTWNHICLGLLGAYISAFANLERRTRGSYHTSLTFNTLGVTSREAMSENDEYPSKSIFSDPQQLQASLRLARCTIRHPILHGALTTRQRMANGQQTHKRHAPQTNSATLWQHFELCPLGEEEEEEEGGGGGAAAAAQGGFDCITHFCHPTHKISW